MFSKRASHVKAKLSIEHTTHDEVRHLIEPQLATTTGHLPLANPFAATNTKNTIIPSDEEITRFLLKAAPKVLYGNLDDDYEPVKQQHATATSPKRSNSIAKALARERSERLETKVNPRAERPKSDRYTRRVEQAQMPHRSQDQSRAWPTTQVSGSSLRRKEAIIGQSAQVAADLTAEYAAQQRAARAKQAAQDEAKLLPPIPPQYHGSSTERTHSRDSSRTGRSRSPKTTYSRPEEARGTSVLSDRSKKSGRTESATRSSRLCHRRAASRSSSKILSYFEVGSDMLNEKRQSFTGHLREKASHVKDSASRNIMHRPHMYSNNLAADSDTSFFCIGELGISPGSSVQEDRSSSANGRLVTARAPNTAAKCQLCEQPLLSSLSSICVDCSSLPPRPRPQTQYLAMQGNPFESDSDSEIEGDNQTPESTNLSDTSSTLGPSWNHKMSTPVRNPFLSINRCRGALSSPPSSGQGASTPARAISFRRVRGTAVDVVSPITPLKPIFYNNKHIPSPADPAFWSHTDMNRSSSECGRVEHDTVTTPERIPVATLDIAPEFSSPVHLSKYQHWKTKERRLSQHFPAPGLASAPAPAQASTQARKRTQVHAQAQVTKVSLLKSNIAQHPQPRLQPTPPLRPSHSDFDLSPVSPISPDFPYKDTHNPSPKIMSDESVVVMKTQQHGETFGDNTDHDIVSALGNGTAGDEEKMWRSSGFYAVWEEVLSEYAGSETSSTF